MWAWLRDILEGLAAHLLPTGKRRSSEWPKVRRVHLEREPYCQVCGGQKDLEVHHEVPFEVNRERELDPDNLITLCRPHHFLAGHLCDWQSWNPEVRADAAVWRRKIRNKPKGKEV
jgi:5-methylcytosine-specific restriction enzyme A